MSSQLDILALEPFYGGVRKSMLETIFRCSRHRWTLLKLPPRRIERRLSVAAHWFSEELARHWSGRLDLLFTSEAMNLADLFNLTRHLSKKPSVVYFHDNQLPELESAASSPNDLVNLSTGMAATELWFNSTYHIKTFTARASKMVERHQELASRNPIPELLRKFRLMPPPIDLQLADHIQQSATPVKRDPRAIFVDTRGADIELLNDGLSTLKRRGQRFKLITLGPTSELSKEIPSTPASESDDFLQMQEMLRCAVFLSVQPGATSDNSAIRAISAGCHPIFPTVGVYRELISQKLFPQYFYYPEPDELASRIQDAWQLEEPDGAPAAMQRAMRPYDAINACKAIDERIEELVIASTAGV